MQKLYIESFGCQMNQLEAELIMGKLVKEGYQLTQNHREADVILLNTCSVREHAEDKAISHAGVFLKRKKKNPDVIVGIVGCMAENLKEKLFERLPEIDLIVGPRKTGAIPRAISEIKSGKEKMILLEDFDDEFIEPYHLTEARKTPFQAYIKAMEGCDMHCTFCVVPNTRGIEVSRCPKDIYDEAKKLADEGVVEITLLGQTINSYGKGLKPYASLADLLYLLSKIEGLKRIRFITSHPVFMKNNLIQAMKELPVVAKYIHIPAQSGSDRILDLMNRRYSSAWYRELVQKLYDEVEDIAVASDFIVGFPSETAEDFDATVKLVEDLRFQGSFIFKYSSRPNTKALGMDDNVPFEEKHRRNLYLLDIQRKISREINESRIGKIEEVLVEGPSKLDKSKFSCRTSRNQIVIID
ncbi:MAG: tRNA (N6-isopentenyl adenosine(37)-C2)-methylthiotransferase MiaB, partial [Planctomycetes bacterium]|nr:tRNA (N6-isopentenyl adenosine(37)-C2)-methylthiotransferase MiaB [Planctomycetota bacterium]